MRNAESACASKHNWWAQACQNFFIQNPEILSKYFDDDDDVVVVIVLMSCRCC
jgi:hypothetical protein